MVAVSMPPITPVPISFWLPDPAPDASARGVTPAMKARAKKLLAEKGVPPEEIEMVIVATVTPDMLFPATACLIQNGIGASRAWGFDLSGACSGFIYALPPARNS